MTLSISDQPSQWCRLSDNPKRLSLLSDATIDPFPQRVTRSASLLEHHIVRDSPLNHARSADDGRRSTLPFLPYRASPLGPDLHHSHGYQHQDHDSEEAQDLSRKRKASMMAEQPSGSSSPASVGQPDGQTQFCLCQPEPKIPRPRNAFILYRQHQQAGVARSHPGLPNPAISKIIGEQWSHLPEEEKDKWKALAEEEKARHAQQYPEYRYQPRRNGRYSSQSSGSGLPSGGKVDQNGNCIKCGGKTMNPPTTPYAVYPTTPVTGKRPSQPLTYPQGHRGSQQVLVSPPRTGVQPQSGQMWIQAPPRDPRYDPRPRYMSEQIDGPDLKRRRYESGYVPTRELYRKVPYPYSPREAQYVRADMHHDPHAPQSAMGPPRALCPQAPPLPPKLQPIRPPPPQHNRRPSLTLPPQSTPSAQTPSSNMSRQGSQNSGLEAMIMSIPVLNKVKILSQISPHLAAPSVASPPREIRGAIVAVEGLDPGSVYSMTNSLADQLVKDGKFSVRIFNGPDPFSTLRGDGKERKELSIKDCLTIIGEWHKISEEMKRFITTKPAGSAAVSPDKDIEMSSSMSSSVVMTEAPSTSQPQDSDTANEQIKTPERTHSRRPSKLDLNPPTSAKKLASGSEEPPTSASKVSPKSIVTDNITNLSISTPPVQRPGTWKNPWSRGENADSPPYTRIPSISNRGTASAAAPGQGVEQEDRMDVENLGADENANGKGKEKEVHFDASANTTITATTKNSLSTPQPSLTHNTLSYGDGPIPIALVPSYQLTTVDASAISMPIVDSYSPLAHWQWLATLWRGCIGPDVSVVIKSTAVAGDGSVRESFSISPASNEDSSPSKIGAAAMGSPRSRQQSIATAAGGASTGPPAPNTTTNTPAGSMSGPSPGSAAPSQAPGVEVRLLDCRAIVVRTNVSHHTKLKSTAEEGEGDTGAMAAEDEAQSKRRREEMEFWEKAKRRVGFEVAEFLRR